MIISIKKISCLFALLFATNSFADESSFESLNHLENAFRLNQVDLQLLDQSKYLRFGLAAAWLDASETSWAGNYFPMIENGIASRWQSSEFLSAIRNGREDRLRFKYPVNIKSGNELLSSQQLSEYLKLHQNELNQLSATEKYDLIFGDEFLRATNWEIQNRGTKRALKVQWWEGFCNGMRAAGILAPEPTHAITYSTKFGVNITLQPADIKALLAATYYSVESYAQVGNPTKTNEAPKPPAVDVIDRLFRSYLGAGRKAFVIDHNTSSQVWNVTVVGYNRQLGQIRKVQLSDQAPAGTTKVVPVTLKVIYLDEADIWPSNGATRNQVANGAYTDSHLMTYELFINDSEIILGGRPTGMLDTNAIDFIWFPGGRGADQYNHGNPYLNFSAIFNWAGISH